MKPSGKKLGLELQLYLMRQGVAVEELAQQLGITPDGLSNLIHGRRRFRDETLERLAQTPLLQQGNFTLARLKALRAMDEYGFEELVLALLMYVQQGEIDRLPPDFFDALQAELGQGGSAGDKSHALLSLMRSGQP